MGSIETNIPRDIDQGAWCKYFTSVLLVVPTCSITYPCIALGGRLSSATLSLTFIKRGSPPVPVTRGGSSNPRLLGRVRCSARGDSGFGVLAFSNGVLTCRPSNHFLVRVCMQGLADICISTSNCKATGVSLPACTCTSCCQMTHVHVNRVNC